jgi:hypothetical protein
MSVKFKIPRILDEATINALKERFKINKQFNRTDVKSENLLNEFSRCARCIRAVKGWIDKKKYKGRKSQYPKYSHPTGSQINCDCRFNLDKQELEDFVFNELGKFTYDRVGFIKALEDQVPDQNQVKRLKKIIAQNEKELKKVDSKIYNLAKAIEDKTIKPETVQKRENELYELRDDILAELEKQQAKLDRLPNLEKLKAEAKKVRSKLLKYYKSPGRLKNMSYDEKWALLNYHFSGRDEKGKRFGIYIDKDDEGKLTISMYGAYMLYKPNQWKKGLQVGTKFEVHKYLDGTDFDPGHFYLGRRRIFADSTLSLHRG